MRLPSTVDARIARAIAYKRIFTGALALATGVGLVVAVSVHGSNRTSPVGLGVALAIFFGGGAWTLRDGLRLLRELARSSR